MNWAIIKTGFWFLLNSSQPSDTIQSTLHLSAGIHLQILVKGYFFLKYWFEYDYDYKNLVLIFFILEVYSVNCFPVSATRDIIIRRIF